MLFFETERACAGQAAIRLAIQNDGDHGANNPCPEQNRVSPRLEHIAGNHTHHQRDSDRHRKGDGQACHVNGSHQQQVGQIEDCPADQDRDDVRDICRVDIVHQAGRIVAGAAHGVPQHQGNQEDADRIVPVEQLETVVLHALEGIGP